MAYNNGFPLNYPQYFAPQYQYQPSMPIPPAQSVQQNAPANGNLIWVQGEAGAKSYLVAPNSTVQLWDSEKQTIYLKSADASGMPSMKTLDYTIRDLPAVNAPVTASAPAVEYVTKAELQTLYGRIEALQTRINELTKGEVKNDGEPAV